MLRVIIINASTIVTIASWAIEFDKQKELGTRRGNIMYISKQQMCSEFAGTK